MDMRRAVIAAPAAGLATGAAVVGYAWLEARNFTVRRFTLPVLPPGSPTLRVLHLSDLHMLPRQRRKAAWLASLAELQPDFVVSTGDNLSGPEAVPTVLTAHGSLLDTPGVFVLGSNDYYAPLKRNPARYLLPDRGKRVLGDRLPTQDLIDGFTKAGWVNLTHRRTVIEVRGVPLEFVGVDDAHLKLDQYHLVAGAPDPDAVVTIGVTHAPYQRVLNSFTDDGAGLILAGHTHGGQVCIPGYGALTTNCDLPTRQAKGVSRWPSPNGGHHPDAAWLHVCAGAGTPPHAAVRLACRPEAALLTLTGPSR